jgi:hypothetical protein
LNEFVCPFSPGDMVCFKSASMRRENGYLISSSEKTSLMYFVEYDPKEASLCFINENGKFEIWQEYMFKVYSDCFYLATRK